MSRKRGGFVLLLFGLIVAFGVAMLVYNQAQRAATTARLESVDVLVAAQDIPERTTVIAPYLAVKRMLPGSLPPNALARPEDVVGKMTTAPILAGEFVLPGKLVGADGRAGLAFTLSKGKVLVTLPATDILSTGAVRPGDSVDLLVTIKPPERESAPPPTAPGVSVTVNAVPNATPTPTDPIDIGTTQTTMQNLKVVGIGAFADAVPIDPAKASPAPGPNPPASPGPAGVLTFEVNPQDALILKALKDNERVKLELVLRAAGDDAVATTDPVTLNTIVERYRFRAVPTPRPTQAAGL